MIFSRNGSFVEQDLKIANLVIERKITVRFLGVIIDEKLSWLSHIAYIKIKMAWYLEIIYQIRSQLPAVTRLQIYHSFVHLHLNYCSHVCRIGLRYKITHRFRLQ